jgi:signal transduction histidine kinase
MGRIDCEDAAGLLEDDVAAITHDLKSPLAVIALEVESLDGRLGEQPLCEQRRALRRIQRNVESMDRLVHELLDLSRMDSARLEVIPALSDLRDILVDTVDRMLASSDHSTVRIESSGPAWVLVDIPRIERVIANLLQNALKYAPDQPVLVKLEIEQNVARVSVIDGGPGLTPDEMRSLFVKHHRCRGASKLDGSGLGLYVSRKIVEAHGGLIGVESGEGGGSRFYFELPLHRR